MPVAREDLLAHGDSSCGPAVYNHCANFQGQLEESPCARRSSHGDSSCGPAVYNHCANFQGQLVGEIPGLGGFLRVEEDLRCLWVYIQRFKSSVEQQEPCVGVVWCASGL